MIRTCLTGSLPKPGWLADPDLYAQWRLQGTGLEAGQDDAVRSWINLQESAGIDIVCDGEQRRRHYIWGFLDGLGGIDTENLGEKASRAGRYIPSTPVPRLTSELVWTRPVIAPAVKFLRSHTDRPIKVTLPGPMTTADSILDEYGGRSNADFAMDYARLLNLEAQACAAAGADVVQFDEPCFNIYIDDVKEWGLEALERAAAGVSAKLAVHICYGYGVEAVKTWKKSNRDWSHYFATLPLIAESSIDQVSIEAAASHVDLACLEAVGNKVVMLGVVSVSTEEVETPQTVAARLKQALNYLRPDQLIGCTDCGMAPLSRQAAIGKIKALALGAALANLELGLC